MTQNQTIAVGLQLIYDPRSQRAFAQMAKEAAKAFKEVHKEAGDAFAAKSDYSTRAGMQAATYERNRARPGFRERQDLLAERAGTMSRLGLGQTAGTMSRIGSAAEGLQGAGFTGAAKFAQRAALPLAIASTAVDTAGKVASYVHDRYSTAEQIQRRAFRELIPGGERIQGLYDQFSGRAAGMEQADISSRFRAAEGQSRLQQAGFGLNFNPQQAGRQGLAEAFRGQKAILPGSYDRTTAEGERLFREEQRLLPLKREEARAEREAAAATKERVSASSELAKISRRERDLTAERADLQGQLSKDENQSGVSRQNVLKRIETVNRELEGQVGLKREAAGTVFGATQKEIEARRAQGRAQVQTLGARADILEGRAETSAGLARNIAGMDPFDRTFALQAARLIKARGTTEGLPPEYIQAGLSIAPQTVGKIMEKAGANSEVFSALKSEFPEDAIDPDEARRKAAALRREAAEKEFNLDAESASKMADAGKAFGRFVGDTFKDLLDAAKVEILNAVRLGRNTV